MSDNGSGNSGTWGPHNIKTDDLVNALLESAGEDLLACEAQNGEHDVCEFCQDGTMKAAAAECIEALAGGVDALAELVEAYDACFEPEGFRSQGPSRGNRLAEALDEARKVLGTEVTA